MEAHGRIENLGELVGSAREFTVLDEFLEEEGAVALREVADRRQVRGHPERVHPWIMQLLERKPVRLATIAMANKAARIIWVILTKGTYYRQAAA